MQFGNAVRYAGLEKDPGFIAMAHDAITELLPKQDAALFRFIQGVVPKHEIDETFDLTVFSYMLSETAPDNVAAMMQFAMKRSHNYITIVDAGTPQVYRQLMAARDVLIKHDWSIIAPCPHQHACPMIAPDFCHFPARFTRHKDMRALKGARAQAEDEKFCYLIAQSPKLTFAQANYDRIVKRPMIRSGHIILDLCTGDGKLARHTVSKKQKSIYQAAKKKTWGDEMDRNP